MSNLENLMKYMFGQKSIDEILFKSIEIEIELKEEYGIDVNEVRKMTLIEDPNEYARQIQELIW